MPARPAAQLILQEQAFELLLNGVMLASLPSSLKPPTLGADRAVTQDRAPLSAVFFGLGDYIQKPGLLTLTGPVYTWQSYDEAIAGMAQIDRACQNADTLNFKGRLWAPLIPGSGWAKGDVMNNLNFWTLTLTLLPSAPVTASTIEAKL